MGYHVALAVMDFRFNGGSMGSVVGEKLTRTIEFATANNLPVIIISASGGARMQEGLISLMQMAKTSAALARHAEAKLLPFYSILTNPTMAGVMASFASLGDVIIAEPKALIGFTGKQVIEETIKQKLPPGFKQPRVLPDHGQVDLIVNRRDLQRELARLIGYMAPQCARNIAD